MSRIEVFFDHTLGQDVVFRNSWMPNFVARSVAGIWFLSNRAGEWLLVSREDLDALTSVAIPHELYRRAEASRMILTAANLSSFFDAYKQWETPHYRHPVHHIIVTTLRCNLACTYCHAAVVPADAGSQYDLSLDVAVDILDFALNSRAPVQSFEFQGGESLLNASVLRSLIPRIFAAYAESGRTVYVSIQTNATMLTESWVAFFKEYGVKIGSSLDGPPALHDQQRVYRDGRGSYDRVQKITDKHSIATLPTITRASMPLWRQIVDHQLSRGTTIVAFHNAYPINSAREHWTEIGMEHRTYLETCSEVIAYIRSLWRDDYYPLERRTYLALKKLFYRRDVDYADFGSPCGMIHSQVAYHTNGDVYTCDEGRDFEEFRLGNVRTDSYDEMMFGTRARALKTLSMPNDDECLSCAYRPFCSTCPVYDRATTGKLTARHAGTDKCHETKFIFDTVLEWLAEEPALLGNIAKYYGWRAGLND